MKLKHLLFAAFAAVVTLASCEKEEELGPASVVVNPGEISFDIAGGTETVSLKATRDWRISTMPDWIGLSVTRGEASAKSRKVSVTVAENEGHDRVGEVVFTIGLAKFTLVVNQAGPEGEVRNGTGTKDDPYTVAGVIAYLDELGADVNSPDKVYIKGKICEITEAYSAQYGNGTFKISDDGSTTASQFTCYRIYYLGNKKWTEGQDQIAVGDDVIIYGNVVNYKGNTPETQQNNAFLYSHNGKTEGGDGGGGDAGQAQGDGSQGNPFNVSAAIAKAKAAGETATAESYYIKGKVAEVKEQFGAQYGNATFTMVDEGFDAVFTAFRVLYFGNKKWTTGGTTLNAGDEVIVYAQIINFKGNTPETSGGYVYSINGKTEDDNPGGGGGSTGEKADPKGTGTESDPFNVSAAIAKAEETGTTATSESYYITGVVTGSADVSAQYGNATFDIVDSGYSAKFKVFRIKSFGGEAFTGSETFKEGDVVVVKAKIVNYNGNTPETNAGGELVTINGKTEFDGGGGGQGGGGDASEYASTVSWTLGTNAYDDISSTVNGVTDVKTLKLGKGSAFGDATLTIPAGATKLVFYAVSWNNVDVATLAFSVNGTSIGSVTPAMNAGLKGNTTYVMTVSDSDKYEIAVTGGTTVKVETTGGYRAAMFGVKAE